jgi:proline dehydrogenase
MRDMDLVMLAIKHELPLQVLYGWHKKFLDYPYKLRIYIPFGTDWWPYIKRRIKEGIKI